MTYQQSGQVSRQHGSGGGGGPSQVWDPGARILIYTDNKSTVTTETKDKNAKHTKQLNRLINTRASPNKSQDSGFSDSGESETSNGSETKGSDFKIKT